MTREVDKMMQLRILMKKAWIPSNLTVQFHASLPRRQQKTLYKYKNIDFIIKVWKSQWLMFVG